jgi:hypothetical protein
VDVPVGIHLKPLDPGHKVFVRVLISELAKVDLKNERASNRWTLLERRDIIIRDIEELVEVKAPWTALPGLPLLLTLKHPEQMQFKGFSTLNRLWNFRSLLDTAVEGDPLSHMTHIYGVDIFHIYRDAIRPALTADQACFTEHQLMTMRFQADIKRKVKPIEVLVVVGFRDNDYAIKGWEWHSHFHASSELESFANDYTAKSDCTVFVDCNEPIKIALRPAPSQHRWNIETPVKEVTITITL